MIETALPSLKAWTDALVNAPIPGLPGSRILSLSAEHTMSLTVLGTAE